ncbi:TonB-dependent receptor [Nafulsella turpanensis]|uniref:TonB-dependent receptor n=1 Tax=Nafulsella turpanensis TaxID=1265690 RepID=UPI00034D60D5|nr:TonB-dependent receptor [Nafulsella turpanensis]
MYKVRSSAIHKFQQGKLSFTVAGKGKVIILLLCLLLICSLAQAQIITVKDQLTGQPLEQVALVSENPAAFATTNKVGQADISAFKGAEVIRAHLLGYEPLIRSYTYLAEHDTILLEPADISLEQVVVSATRWNQSAREVPARINSITPAEIALQQPQTAADLLGASGEVFIQKSQLGGGSPVIRGFSTNRLLLTVDGVRMNTAIFRSGNLQNVISLDPFAIESAEVLFGPGSVMYGSDAIGGVMSFQTLTPRFSLSDDLLISGNATARFSSASNELTGHFDVNVGWQKWAFISSFTFTDYDDLLMGSHGPDEYLRPFFVQRIEGEDVLVTNENPRLQRPTGYSQANLMQKVRFQPNEAWELQYGFHYSATSDFPRYDRHIRLHDGLPRSAEWYYGPQVWMMNLLEVSHEQGSSFYDELSLRLAHQFFEESRIDRDFNEVERRSRVEEVNAYSANLDFLKGIGERHQLFYGLEAVYDDVHSIGTDEDISTGVVVAGPSRYPESSWASYGAYLTYQYEVSEDLLLQTGARYNHFKLDAVFDTRFYPFPFETANINNGALTGSQGFVYNPTATLSLNANISTGFRSPNVDDVGKVFDSEPGSVVVPNPNLGAEYAWNAEVGAAKVWGNVAKLDATAYYTILNDALVRRNFSLNGQDSIVYDGELSQVQAVQNAAVARVYGVQAGVELNLPGHFGFSSQLSYQKGEEELDDGSTSPSRHAAPLFGVSHFTFKTEPLTLDLYALYSGEKSFEELPLEEQGKDYIYAIDDNGNPYSPAWYTLNFKVLYLLNEQFTLGAGVENLTDQRYRPYSSGIVAPGRNFIFSLSLHF